MQRIFISVSKTLNLCLPFSLSLSSKIRLVFEELSSLAQEAHLPIFLRRSLII